ncbi:hypothetical protein [Halochromatium sp.]
MAQAKHQAIADKQQILDTLRPKSVLQPMTAEATDVVPESQLIEGYVVIVRFPFRVGRESRVKLVNGRLGRTERPKFGNEDPNNDLYLIDRGSLLNISRGHFFHPEGGGRLSTH